MPEISRFYGIVIKMLYEAGGKHNKPHVHVEYGEYEASVGIDGEVLAGVLPEKQYKLVAAWLALHEDELYEAWNNAVQMKQLQDKTSELIRREDVLFKWICLWRYSV